MVRLVWFPGYVDWERRNYTWEIRGQTRTFAERGPFAQCVSLVFLFMFAQIERVVGFWRAFSWRGNEFSETGAFEQRMEVDSEGKRKRKALQGGVCVC